MNAPDSVDDAARKIDRATDQAARHADRVSEDMKQAADDVASATADAADRAADGHGVINRLHRVGLKSEYAYIAGFASIALSLTSWLISRGKQGDDKSQSDRWGIFVGHWAPTFFGLGIALKLEEKNA